MKFLRDQSDAVELLKESTDAGTRVYISGIFAQADVKNKNGRVYGKSMLAESVARYNEDFVSQRKALGELNHPERPLVDPVEAAILIESLDWEGNNLIGKARVLDTPKGQIVQALMDGGFNMGVSTRGLGNIVEKAGTKYVNKYMLTAIDCVSGPSAPDAYVSMLRESVEYEERNGMWVPKHLVDQSRLMNNLDRLIESNKKNRKA